MEYMGHRISQSRMEIEIIDYVRVGEYLRYSSERYRRYGGFSIFILDTILRKQYLSGIFSYLAKQKIRSFAMLHGTPVSTWLVMFWSKMTKYADQPNKQPKFDP